MSGVTPRNWCSYDAYDLLQIDTSRQLVHLMYFPEERAAHYRSDSSKSLGASMFAHEVQFKLAVAIRLGGLDKSLLIKLMKKNKDEFENDLEKSNLAPTELWDPFS